MASTRAEAVAEALWELKREDKVSTYSLIASRAGFSAGSNGRAMATCIKTIRKDWPHLEWWRAIRDDNVVDVEEDQQDFLAEWGAEIADEGGKTLVQVEESQIKSWEAPKEANN